MHTRAHCTANIAQLRLTCWGASCKGVLTNVRVQVAAGFKHNLAIVGDGRLFSWGWNGLVTDEAGDGARPASGALGLGHSEDAATPEEVQWVMTAGGAALKRQPAFKANRDQDRDYNWYCSHVRPPSRHCSNSSAAHRDRQSPP